jgi:hypothetical protein
MARRQPPAEEVSLEPRALSQTILVRAPAQLLYDLVSDITRTGEFSPVCTSRWWDEGDGPRVGAWFTGRNQTPDRTWETRSQVVAATPTQEFSFVVGAAFVRWGYTFAPTDEGTAVTESWEFLPAGIAMFHERYGDDAAAQIADRTRAAREGIPVTLAALKQAAEAGSGVG